MRAIVTEDDIRLVRILLSNTTISVRLGKEVSPDFKSTIGTPKVTVSPVVFVIYLESALREIRASIPPGPMRDMALPPEVNYADGTDFISQSRPWLESIEPDIIAILGDWHLKINEDKTEKTTLRREGDRLAEVWRKTKKLGSLLGDEDDFARRKQLATAAFRALFTVWCSRSIISESLRLRHNNVFIIPVLTYNGGTWGLTASAWERLDTFHRRQLRSLLGIRWPQVIPNKALYGRCHAVPISALMRRSRWGLFEHILRLPQETPAALAMQSYFTCGDKVWQGRPRTTIVSTLSADLESAGLRSLRNLADLEHLQAIATDRPAWRELCKDVRCN